MDKTIEVIGNTWVNYSPYIIGSIAVIGGIFGQRWYQRRKNRELWDNVGKNVVALHSFRCHDSIPNLGPFVVKLETFFKLAGIKYKTDYDHAMGPKGKLPWITFNGKDYADSQLIMEFLGKYFGKDFSHDLTIEEQAIARSMQILAEEHLYWALVSWRYIEDPELRVFSMTDSIPTILKYLFPIFRQRLSNALWAQGVGRHTIEERRSIFKKDIVALSQYLGKKPFFMGDTPREVDCCLYGILSQIVWNTPGSPYEKLVKGDCKNIQEYCERMKKRFFTK